MLIFLYYIFSRFESVHDPISVCVLTPRQTVPFYKRRRPVMMTLSEKHPEPRALKCSPYCRCCLVSAAIWIKKILRARKERGYALILHILSPPFIFFLPFSSPRITPFSTLLKWKKSNHNWTIHHSVIRPEVNNRYLLNAWNQEGNKTKSIFMESDFVVLNRHSR